MRILDIHNLSYRYEGQEQPVLHQVSFGVEAADFLVLCGRSGSGKSTLLRQLKPIMALKGEVQGEIYIHHQGKLKEIWTMSPLQQATSIGFVGQNPEDQVVTDKVWHELAFGLENLGYSRADIRRRVAEISQFFGISSWFHKNTADLSGGQKQILNLASAMIMSPELLLLDEPTSQLDPIAREDFMHMLHRIHQELGTTIILVEHNLESVMDRCNKMVLLEQGRIVAQGSPVEVLSQAEEKGFGANLPTPVRMWNRLGRQGDCPLTVAEGREWLENREGLYVKEDENIGQRAGVDGFLSYQEVNDDEEQAVIAQEALIKLENVGYSYSHLEEDVLNGLDLTIWKGERLVIFGGNGSGKSTLLHLLCGNYKPQRGTIWHRKGQCIALLPQNPQQLFSCDTVEEELHGKAVEAFGLEGLFHRHPYDLSGGEQQKLALAKVLMAKPDILLLDEPTKGCDGTFKREFTQLLYEINAQGVTLIMVSHDVEFGARFANRCVLLFDGQVATENEPRAFLKGNYFYTTPCQRICQGILPDAVFVEDLHQEKEGVSGIDEESEVIEAAEVPTIKEQSVDAKNPYWREISYGKEAPKKSRLLWGILTLGLVIPFTVFAGIYYLQDDKYLFISLLILLECMLPFFLSYEARKPQTKDMVLVAVLCAIGVMGRVAFVALPQFKPVLAIVVIAGVVFGVEGGFLVGALIMLASNMIFGQGPWTPWQMVAAGFVGALAGVFFHRWNLQGNKILGITIISVFGFVATVAIYGIIMDIGSLIMSQMDINKESIIVFLTSGFVMNLVHGVSTLCFLVLGGLPIINKLRRVREKYQ